MINAIAIDDEPLALEVLEQFCERDRDIKLLKTFTKSQEGLKFSQNYPVDLVFLDIQMPSILGTDLAKELRPEVMVIFTTAYDQFAIEGFNLDAVDYLLKPFSYSRFLQALEKVKKYKTNVREQKSPGNSFINIRADYSLLKIELESIFYIEGLDDYVKIHLMDKKVVVARMTMKGILDVLPKEGFIRVHRSFIVPTSRVSGKKNNNILLGNTTIPIGGSFKDELKKLF